MAVPLGREPARAGLRLFHDHGRSLQLDFNGVDLLRYVYTPWDVPLESPRPYFHPLRTLGGRDVSLYRPHDHVWHKGMAWSLPNVAEANFWGGPTYIRDRGYQQLENNGSMRHDSFDKIEAPIESLSVRENLSWITQDGQLWFTERRTFTVGLTEEADAWVLGYATTFTNVSGRSLPIGSPTTQGRDNAGYAGLFWRGPRSFTGGSVYAPGRVGGDEMMGMRSPWLGFAGRHDVEDGASTVVFVDSPGNGDQPTQWFVRSEPFACIAPAPFFSVERSVEPDESLSYAYAVAIADGDRGIEGSAELAAAGEHVLGDLGPSGEAADAGRKV